MFKFKIKVDDEHSFKSFVKNIHDFSTKALNATILKDIEMINKYNSNAFIGGRRIELNDLEDRLKNLSPSLRQLVGAYVYIKAKMKLSNITTYYNSMITTLISKLRIGILHKSKSELIAKIRVKVKWDNNYSSSLNIKLIIAQKLKLVNKYVYNTTMKYSIKMKTKLSLLYNSSTVASSRMKAKLRFNNVQSSLATIKFLLKTKIRFTNNHYNHKINVEELLTAKAKGLVSYKNSTNIGGHMPLISYCDDKLNELPSTLKRFVGSVTRLLAFAKLPETQRISNSLIGRTKSKLRASSLINIEPRIESDGFGCKRLIDYQNIKLSSAPERVFDFCYGTKVDSWRNIMKSNLDWQEVKNNYRTWQEVKGRVAQTIKENEMKDIKTLKQKEVSYQCNKQQGN